MFQKIWNPKKNYGKEVGREGGRDGGRDYHVFLSEHFVSQCLKVP